MYENFANTAEEEEFLEMYKYATSKPPGFYTIILTSKERARDSGVALMSTFILENKSTDVGWSMGLIIKKRFGPRNFVQYLHLKDVYTVGTKAKKEQQVYVKGGTGYIYKQTPVERAAYDSQQTINTSRHGSFTPYF